MKWTSENYFKTMGNRMVAGRDFTWADTYNRAPFVIFSENLAREFWKDPAQALGKRVRQTPKHPWRTIIGVVGNERDDGVVQPAPAIIYWPLLIDSTTTTSCSRGGAWRSSCAAIGSARRRC